ncbi:MAG TPA: hypothetical protein VK880_05325 [Anaerolineales bacterium]|nr:hypothetical protein [Anaerolineales bacterium]
MRKSTVFISAVLTTFALVMLYRIASAYNDNQNITETAAESTATLAPTATEPPAPTEVALGPEEAAQKAAEVVGNTNLLSAESSTFDGVDAWMVTFTNNDVVYIGLDGQILGVQVAPEVVTIAPPAKRKNKNNGGNQSASSAPVREEDHERDEDEDEHDD